MVHIPFLLLINSWLSWVNKLTETNLLKRSTTYNHKYFSNNLDNFNKSFLEIYLEDKTKLSLLQN